MEERLSELKEKQEEIGSKINQLQVTNKKKDEEAAEIRRLIADCRENLNRIKNLSPGDEVLPPCSELEALYLDAEKDAPRGSRPSNTILPDIPSPGSTSQGKFSQNKISPVNASESVAQPVIWAGVVVSEAAAIEVVESGAPSNTMASDAMPSGNLPNSAPHISALPNTHVPKSTLHVNNSPGSASPRIVAPCPERNRCSELLKKKDCSKSTISKRQMKGKGKEKVSCRVDLNKMKVRVKGPSEDLKKLDATQLISLLEKFQCSELIINTGDEIIRDPGEIRLVYFLHPGNIVMAAGVIMIAFLINANLCNPKRTCRTKFLLNILYLSSFAFHYGMVLWMSFIRGYALKFGLSHDTFNSIDNLILPKYFSVCVLLSALSLYSLLATHCVAPCTSWPLEVVAQMIVLVVTFLMELVTICYIVPALIKLRDTTDDYVLDDEEPECSVPDSYEKNLIKLRKLNWTICLVNLLTLIFLGANAYYITSKLDIGDN